MKSILRHYVGLVALAMSATCAIVSCMPENAHAQPINPSQPATGVPLAGTGIAVAGQTVSINYGVANSPFTGNMSIGGTLSVTGAFSPSVISAVTSIGAPAITASTSLTTATLTASGTVSGTGFTNLFASPPPIGSTAANTGTFTAINGTTITGTTLTGTSLTLGTGQIVAGFTSTVANSVNRTLYGKTSDDLSPKDFGALGNGVTVNGALTTTATSPAITMTNAVFTAADVGKLVIVPGAGTAGVALVTTISTFTDATHVSLAANAVTSQTAIAQVLTYGTNDTTAIQLAVNNTCLGCTLRFPNGIYLLNAAIRLPQPITIQGPGNPSYGNQPGAAVVQTNTAANGFTMVASLANYRFSAFGILNIAFKDIAIKGPADNTLAADCIGVDATINSGVFHIRNNLFQNITVKDCTNGVNLVGIAYLNDFIGGSYAFNTTGLKFAQGLSGTVGGQTRIIGVQIDFNLTGISWFEDTNGGDLSVIGSTMADGVYGLRANQYAGLSIFGSHFESLTNGAPGVLAGGAGIYIPITINANPNSATDRVIEGNYFLSDDNDIVINQTATGFVGGGFAFPMRVDANYFADASALLIAVPVGHVGLDSNQFVWGASNAGPTGPINPSQISTNFLGILETQRRITKRFVLTAAYVSGQILASYPANFTPLSARLYLTANSSGFTSCSLGDAGNNARYVAAFNAQTQALNTWLNWTPPVPQFQMAGSGVSNQPILVCTAGTLSLAGVVEIDGYVP